MKHQSTQLISEYKQIAIKFSTHLETSCSIQIVLLEKLMKIIDPFAEKFSNDLSIVKDLKNLANYMNNECKKFKKRTTVTFQNEIPHNTSDKDIEVKRENVISESALDITRFEDAQGFKVSDQLLINESCVSEGNFDKLLQKILSPPSKFNSSNTEYMGNEILLRNKSNGIKNNYFNYTIIHEMNTPIGIQSYSPWLLSPIAKQQYSNNNSIDDYINLKKKILKNSHRV